MTHSASSSLSFRNYVQKRLRNNFKSAIRRGALLVVILTLVALPSLFLTRAAISLSTVTPATQNFDGIGTTATAALPADLRADRPATVRTVGTFAAAGSATTQAGGANLSTSAANGIYNFASGTTATGPDRAVGFLSSGTATASGNLYAQYTNNSGGNFSGLSISYDVEKYRSGLNPSGFRFQLFYSTDGSTWTNAGSDFLTSFPADANNNGFATAPGATVSITNKVLNVTIPSASDFFLAWNYSVASGTTTTNAQGLAIDNISVLGIAGGGATSPTGVGAANPSSVFAGDSTLLTVNVTPGTNPTSSGLAVSADLSPIGGGASQQFFDDGTHGDATAGDNVFSFQATVAAGTTTGTKNLPVSIADAESRTGTASISFTIISATNPTGTGLATPSSLQAGGITLLTVSVTPGANPTSTGLTVSADLSAIGGSGTQQFFDDGTNGDVTAGDRTFSFRATVSLTTTAGLKNLPAVINDAQSRTGSASISLVVQSAPVTPGMVVISQVYGGGGNSGATLKNDFIELFNRSSVPIDLTGWTVQYVSAAGTGTWSRTNLSGIIPSGGYYLVQEAAGNGGSLDLPTPDAVGTIAMSATSAKVALVNNSTALSGSCPSGSNIIDLVGYGSSASCFEGTGAAPDLGNTLAAFRTHLGCKDTDDNSADFTVNPPDPRNSASPAHVCPAGDLEPEVFSTIPARNANSVPIDSSITIRFDEPVDVTGNWFSISGTLSGAHTAMVSGGPTIFTLKPDTSFVPLEQVTVTIFAVFVSDQDTIDPPDHLAADYIWTFGSAHDPAENLVMGNPSGATTDVVNDTNFLMQKVQYSLSYNRLKGTPNWTSWHLDQTWFGSTPRQDDFRNDTDLPPGFYQVLGTDYSGSGFDRGHMCPSADRTASVQDNSNTFLMTNMVPQAPDNNQGPWAGFESYLRVVVGQGNELYIISGPSGQGGVGSNGPASVIANGNVVVPQETWKVALVLPVGDDDVNRVTNQTRTIAVIMPNLQGIRNDQWQKYLATVDQVEALTGYNFFSNVPDSIQDAIESKFDAVNDTAPVALDQNLTTAEDNTLSITLTANDVKVNTSLSFTVVTGPAHGTMSGSGANLVYTPASNYSGPDSLVFKASDGTLDSQPATVNINVTEVNDPPFAGTDSKSTNMNTMLMFPATDLLTNDDAGPNETGQTITVTSVSPTPGTHGTVTLSSGVVNYSPDHDFFGSASFEYTVCDNGSTAGAPDSKCATGTVNVTVIFVDTVAPVITVPSDVTGEATGTAGRLVTFVASAVDQVDGPRPVACSPSSGSVFPLGTTTVTCSSSDEHGNTASAHFNITIVDTTPPTLIVPSNILAKATSGAGATVSFTTSASDLVDGAVPVSCTPPSGSTFAVGVVTVTCSAMDIRHNTAVGSFTVTTLGARGIVQGVRDQIVALRQTVTNRVDQQGLDRIINKLTLALDPTLWVDDMHVDPRHSQRVFDLLNDAVALLVDLQKDKRSTIPDSVLQGFIDDLVNANRLVAVVAISDATDAGGDPKKLDKAADHLRKGDQDNANHHYHDAIGHYGDAWDKAKESTED
ncbi:MAG TPA: DNA/RNA non-specific endonuclease [Blastocatellia bacterium]|nr:DNA/RNA non-specific endonuclease [Blastocatellia bacterium]